MKLLPSKTTIVAVILAAIALSSCLVAQAEASRNGRPPRTPTFSYQPDLAVRAQVRGVQSNQVASMEFFDLPHGMAVPIDPSGTAALHPSFSPVVTRRRLIALFLYALRDASEYTGPLPANAKPSLRINFRRSGQRQRDPLDIELNQADFGPEFWSVMQTLPGYLTEQLHQCLYSIGPQVREVDFAGLKVTDPVKVSWIVRSLEQVKPGAFEVWSSDNNFEVKLLLNGRATERVILSTDPPGGSHTSPLPATLLAYYKEVQHPSKGR